MEKLTRALSIIQKGMLRNNPRNVTNCVNEATEVFGYHGYLLETAFCVSGRYPIKLTKGEKRVVPSHPEDRIPKEEKASTLPTYAAATRGQTPQKDGEWLLVKRKKKK